jgi:hypothetical protein
VLFHPVTEGVVVPVAAHSFCLRHASLPVRLVGSLSAAGSLTCPVLSPGMLCLYDGCRHLATFYHVEILCRLGSEHEAAVLLKASAAATLSAWQTTLLNSAGSSGNTVGNIERNSSPHPKALFFSGNQRVKELSAATPGQVATVLKQLHRVNDAVVLLLRAETDAARVILEDVVRVDKDLVPAVQNLLYVYVRQGKNSEALALLRLVNCLPHAS